MPITQLDAVQCVKQAFDEPNNSFRVEADITGSSVELEIGQDSDSIQVAPFRGTFTDRSGTTSGTANTSTLVAAANSNRHYFIIENIDSLAYLYVNFTSAAAPSDSSILLLPYGSYVMEASFITTEAIYVCSSGTSTKFVAKEG